MTAQRTGAVAVPVPAWPYFPAALPQRHAAPSHTAALPLAPQMVRLIGQKRARELWFLARLYDAQQALAMGLVNTVVPLAQLETETLVW